MMPVQPPTGCLDPRLWATAYELSQQHADDRGRCSVCAMAAPCPKAEAAREAMQRALPPPPREPTVYRGSTEVLSPPPVGARFPRERHIGRRRRPG
jgi:hypothetical protein